jgi:hypothetical protein
MSKWFQPLPDDLSDLVGASKFQHETMARLVRFYKGKCSGQKELIERLRREVDTLKVSWDSISTRLTAAKTNADRPKQAK